MSVTTLPATPAPLLLARSRAGAIGLVVVAVLGPICLALSHFVSPFGHDGFAVMYADLAANPVAAQWEMLLTILGAVFGSVGALVVGAAVRVGSPKFGSAAAAIAFVGFALRSAGLQWSAILAAPDAGITAAQAEAMSAGMDSQLHNAVLAPLSVALFAGVLLLGIAGLIAARRRLFPLWIAILLTASIVILFTMGSLMLGGILPFAALSLGWILLAVAFAAAGSVYVRQVAGDRLR